MLNLKKSLLFCIFSIIGSSFIIINASTNADIKTKSSKSKDDKNLVKIKKSKDDTKNKLAQPRKIEKTFAIIKPDAVQANNTGLIIQLIELNKFSILKMKKLPFLTRKQAQIFYKIHKDKPFFNELINYITSGPIIVLALEKENAVKDWRELMGATNPEKSAMGTMRKMFGTSITKNAVHGSDSLENANIELNFFFPELQYA